jgi:hypothetical protein
MKIYLDDVRPTREGFVRCFWPDEVIELLKTREVRVLSLDHDLGDDARGTGYDVLLWLEGEMHEDETFPLPVILVHSANPVGRQKMAVVIDKLQDLAFRRPDGLCDKFLRSKSFDVV